MEAGRPAIMTDLMKSKITKILEDKPKLSVRLLRIELRTFLIDQMKKDHQNLSYEELIAEVDNGEEELYGYKLPSSSSIDYYIRDNKIREKILRSQKKPDKLDTFWTSASLNIDRISPAAIPWLTSLQIYRKLSISKPITIREARWFDNLLNFREDYHCPWEINLTPEYEDIFLSHAIATWAQIYAYRERIDTIAGIEDADYSDLDDGIATGDFSKLISINDYSEKLSLSPDRQHEYLISHLVGTTRLVEIFSIAHSLGYPDMADSSIFLYAHGLASMLPDNTFNIRTKKLSYIQRFHFLVLLREWAKEHSDADDDMIKPMIEQNFDKVQSECSEWENQNWKVLKIPQG